MAQRLPSGRFDVRLSLVLGMVLATALRADEPKPPGPGVASTPGTAFTYQGQVLHNGVPVNGTCDFQFRLYDAPTGGTQVGPQVNANNLGVSNGLFTALLDFGPNAFTGAARWLEVGVRCPAGSGGFTPLSPRQGVVPVPYALWTVGGPFWGLAGNAGTNPATHYLGTTDAVALEVRVGGARALRLEPGSTPNIIGGWSGNNAPSGVVGATISGGGASSTVNWVTDNFGTIGGGGNNQAGNANANPNDASFATIGGGVGNTASGDWATIGGGEGNTASGALATIGGGQSNTASGWSATIGGGQSNIASGAYATVPGGRGNTASGNYAFATGRRAQATHEGSFVWGDATDADVASSAPNQTTFRSTGGFRIFTNTALSTGVQVPAGGNSWASISDRALKDNLTPVDGQDVLRRLLGVPVYTYTLKSQDPSVKHMGPVAQDFARAFGLGEDERYIGSANADGVLMAALQGLALRLQEREAELARQKEEMDALKARLGTLEALVAALLTTSQRP